MRLCAALVVCASLASSARALPAAQAVARRYAEAIVTVARADAKGESQGFFVSSSGVACTVLVGASVGDAVTITGEQGAQAGAVVVVDPDGLALVALSAQPATPITALDVARVARAGADAWLVGLAREKAGVAGVVGGRDGDGIALVPVPRGAPLLSTESGVDSVVAVALRGKGGGRVQIVEAARVLALAKRLARADDGSKG